MPKVDIKILNETYLDMYQARFGEKFMVYNPHIEYHLPEIREENGDLTSIWTFAFESSYGDLGKNTVKGTFSTTKSSMEKTFLGM